MFRVLQHPSSGVLKIVIAASVTGHNSGTASGQATLEGSSCTDIIIRPRWREVAVPILLSGHVGEK